MSKMLRIILIIIVSATLWLPGLRDAEAAAWHAPSGWGHWTIQPVCRDGVQVIRVLFESDDPEEHRGFTNTEHFSAFAATATGSLEPQKIFGSVPLGEEFGSAYVPMSHQSTPFHYRDDENQTQGIAYVHGTGKITWEPLPKGTTVVVKRTNIDTQYFIGIVTDCYL